MLCFVVWSMRLPSLGWPLVLVVSGTLGMSGTSETLEMRQMSETLGIRQLSEILVIEPA